MRIEDDDDDVDMIYFVFFFFQFTVVTVQKGGRYFSIFVFVFKLASFFLLLGFAYSMGDTDV